MARKGPILREGREGGRGTPSSGEIQASRDLRPGGCRTVRPGRLGSRDPPPSRIGLLPPLTTLALPSQVGGPLYGPLLMPVSYLISFHCFVKSDIRFVPIPQHRQASVSVASIKYSSPSSTDRFILYFSLFSSVSLGVANEGCLGLGSYTPSPPRCPRRRLPR